MDRAINIGIMHNKYATKCKSWKILYKLLTSIFTGTIKQVYMFNSKCPGLLLYFNGERIMTI